MLVIKEKKVFIKKIPPKGNFILVSDIGATKSDFAVVQIQKSSFKILLTIKLDSQKIDSFENVINQLLKYLKNRHKITVTKASFAVAGKLNSKRDRVELTNLKLYLDVKKIKQETGLKSVVLLNDVEAIAYGIQVLNKKCFIQVNKVKIPNEKLKLNKIILSAGTGLGQSFLLWDKKQKKYFVLPSEGGHCSFSVQNKEELDLINFIKKNCRKLKNSVDNIEREEIVSGEGISSIYKFLEKNKKYKKTKYSELIKKNDYSPILMSHYRNKDLLCKKTFELFSKFYARVAKNFALEILASGGIYLAGKIAKENLDVFKQKAFLDEFVNSYKMKSYLSKIPVFVITDLNVALYGAAVYGLWFEMA